MNFLLIICRSARDELLANKDALLLGLRLPIGLILIGLLLTAIGMGGVGVLLTLIAYPLIAITVHRQLLHAPDAEPGTSPLLRYVLWSLGIGFIVACIVMLFTKLTGGHPQLALISVIPASYVFSRLSLILPDRAIGDSTDIGEIWQLSEGNGWKLAAVVVGIPALFNLLTLGLLSVSPPPVAALLIPFIGIFNIIVLIFEAALLSVAYRGLRELKNTKSDSISG